MSAVLKNGTNKLTQMNTQSDYDPKKSGDETLAHLHERRGLYDSFLKEIDITAEEATAVPLPSDEQLLEDELWEKYGEEIA